MDFASLFVAATPLRETSQQSCLVKGEKQSGKNFLQIFEEEKNVDIEHSQLEILLNLLNSDIALSEKEKAEVLYMLENEGELEKDFPKIFKILQEIAQEGLKVERQAEIPVQKMESFVALEKTNLLAVRENLTSRENGEVNNENEGKDKSSTNIRQIAQQKDSAILLKTESPPVNNLANGEEIKGTSPLPHTELQNTKDIEKNINLEGTETTAKEEKNVLSFARNLSAGEQEFANNSFSFSHELGKDMVKVTFIENNFSNLVTQGLKSLEQEKSLPQQLPLKEVPEFILKQIQTNLQVNDLEGSSQLTVRLKPESLGKLTLQLQSHNGHIAVKILAENAQVKEFLEQNLIHLRESLNNQGIKSSSVEVQISRDNQFSQFDQNYNPFAQNKGNKKKTVLKEEKEAWKDNLNYLQEKYASKGISKVEFLA